MAQVHKVRLPDGRTVRPVDWTSTPLYSTVEINDGAIQPLVGFSYGEGGPVPGSPGPRASNVVDTNMNGDGSILQENEELMCFSIMVEFFTIAATLADFYDGTEEDGSPDVPFVSARNMLRIQSDTLLSLRIAETKEYLKHPVGFFPASMGVQHYMGAMDATLDPGATRNDVVLATNGSVASFDQRMLGTPHHIRPGEQFEISLEFPNGEVQNLNLGGDANARIRARIYADGYRKRPVA